MARRTSPWVEAVIRVLLTLLLAWGLVAVLRSMDYRWNWAVFWNARHEYLRGLQMTLFLSLCAMALALVLGSIAALGRLSRQIVLRHLADVYVEVVRGTPLLAQIFIMWYGVF
ncbi:MAG TPA: ABC transporter permease subunit, partial [bacterium]|nr:ABC transporter permease subunit [bacterium]